MLQIPTPLILLFLSRSATGQWLHYPNPEFRSRWQAQSFPTDCADSGWQAWTLPATRLCVSTAARSRANHAASVTWGGQVDEKRASRGLVDASFCCGWERNVGFASITEIY